MNGMVKMAILEKAKIEDGKLDIDGVMSTVNSEFPKYAVPKNVFNDKVTELKTATKPLRTLNNQMPTMRDCRRKSQSMKARLKRSRQMR